MTIGKEEFIEYSSNLIMGLLEEWAFAVERNPSALSSPPPFDAIMEEIFKVTRPGVTSESIDLTVYKDRIRGYDQVNPEYMFLRLYQDADGGFLSSYIDGKGDKPGDEFMIDVNEIATEILVDRGLASVEEIEEYMPPSVRTLRKEHSVLAAMQEAIDRQVEEFREEMNSKLDSIFGEGGES